MATYVDTGDVTPRLGGRTVDTTTSPTAAQVGEWLDEKEGELLGTLEAVGVSSVFAVPSRGANLIRGWVSDHVAQKVVLAHKERDGLATAEDHIALLESWRRFLRELRNDPAGTAAMLTGATAPSSAVGIGSHVTSQTEAERTPIFQIGKFHQ